MTCRLVALCFDANDPVRLARFWSVALGWDVSDGETGTGLDPTDGTTFRIRFEPVSEPKVGKNPIHLDLTTTSLQDQRASVERLLQAGGRHVDVGQGPDEAHVVFGDPEGNEFCLIEPYNRFLAGRERLGSITCDGSPRVGYFWSEALGWPLFWDQDAETAIRTADGTGPYITWGPPVPARPVRSRLHLHVAAADRDPPAEAQRLESLGAARIGRERDDAAGIEMIDPDGNEFRVVR